MEMIFQETGILGFSIQSLHGQKAFSMSAGTGGGRRLGTRLRTLGMAVEEVHIPRAKTNVTTFRTCELSRRSGMASPSRIHPTG